MNHPLVPRGVLMRGMIWMEKIEVVIGEEDKG
jgi:hypothetical protein